MVKTNVFLMVYEENMQCLTLVISITMISDT